MGRKVSIGVVGSGGGLGTIVAGGSGNTLTTAVTNQNLVIDPNGTGITQIVGAAQLNAQSELRLADTDSSNYIAQKAAGTISANYTITWPAAVAASNGYVLSSQTDGTLAWTAIPATGVTAADPGSTATVHYPLFETSTGSIPTGALTTAKVRSNLSFVPSTGILSATGFSGSGAGLTGTASSLTVGTATTATNVTNIATTGGSSSSSTFYPTFVSSNTSGNYGATTTAALTFVPSTGTLTATILTASSDERLKENVVPLSGALNTILQLLGVEFNRIGRTEKEIGVIAQQVEKIVPQLVTTGEDGMKSVAYGNITALLIEAIKEQQAQIEDLTARIK